MKINRYSRTALLTVLVFCIYLVGCSFESNKDSTGKHNIAVITKSTQSAFWKSVFAGAGAAGTEYNLDITFEGPGREEDYETQNKMIRRAVSDGAEAIVFSAVDFNANTVEIEEAADNGVKIVIIDSDVNSNKVSVRIGTDNYEAGRLAGTAAIACEEEELYVGIVNYDINSANGQQREQGFRSIMEKEARVKEIHTINVVSTTEEAKDGTKKLLADYPEINLIVTFNEWTSLGVGWAIRELNAKDNVMVVAFDSNVVSVGMLETGEVDALIVQNPYAMGYLGIEAAYYLVKGNKPEQNIIDTATTLVTRENMFEPECQKMLFNFD